MKRLSLSLLIIIVVCLGISFSHAETTTKLKIMTWNLEDMDIFDGNGTDRILIQEKREKAIAAVIRRIDPDVMLIQEAPSLIELKYFVQSNKLPYQVAHVRNQKGRKSFSDGMAMLFKEHLSLKSISLETPAIPGSNRKPKSRYLDWSMRGLLTAQFESFVVIGVHLKSPGSSRGKAKKELKAITTRLNQAKGLIDYADQFQVPVIIAGDFNDGPGIGDMEKKHKIQDTISTLESVFIRAPGDQPTHEKGFKIDHIMVKGGKISDKTVQNVPWILSDHRPVWTIVTLGK